MHRYGFDPDGVSEQALSDSKAYTYDAKISNFDDSVEGTYDLRYWVNDQYWDSKEGPTFVFVCGEWRCTPTATNSFGGVLAKQNRAKIVTVEHRYYGDSQPFSDAEGGWSLENLKFLTPEEAMADLAALTQHLLSQNTDNDWERVFVVGGSYPGALVSWFRETYPHVAFAALSSSGVVEAEFNFHEFDEQIILATEKSNNYCTSNIRKAMKLIDQYEQTGDEESMNALKKSFNAEGMPTFDFYFFIADMVVMPVQYGDRVKFCHTLGDE